MSCRACAQNQLCQINTCVLITGGSGGGVSGTGGGSAAGGSAAGGSAAGGSAAGGSAAGGAAAGGSAAGGSAAGGSAAGGSAAGGSAAGGSAAGGAAAGGSAAGGSAAGGSAAGGSAGGSAAGGTAGGGSAGCGVGPACNAGQRCELGVCICDGSSCPAGCCSAARNCVAMAQGSCNINGGACISCGSTANVCTSGVCRCGTSASCASGQRCSSGVCVCDATSCPGGCCDAAGVCAARTAATCGTSGGACVACGATADTCSTNGTCLCGVLPACGSGQACVSGSCSTAGADWVQRITPQPTSAYATAVAWDSVRQRLVLFGGRGSTARLAETWELGPSGWLQRTLVTSPPPRSGHDMAYDPVRQRVVLFGGFPDTTTTRLGDTWEWDGTTWTQRTPATSPTARSGHRMAWDPLRNVVVLFGGRVDGTTATSYQSDTWTWNGTTWTLAASTGPTAREGVAIAWDPGFTGGRLVLHGGLGNTGNRGDTFAWDGASWTTVALTASPPNRVFHDMVYSPTLGKLLLFGGATGGSATATYFSDTWVFDRTTWTLLTPLTVPGVRSGHAMEWDPSRSRVTFIGGWNGSTIYADQWEY
ncbi:MAG: kelch repeat-containing protein [Myxococcales bacterium]|nr:kelch repeat-containing protein [Myxococcales bacterium]